MQGEEEGVGIVPPVGAPASDIIAAAVASAEAQMDADRKTTALKALQVRPCIPTHSCLYHYALIETCHV